MTNGPEEDYWHHHFSADEICTSYTTFLFFILQTVSYRYFTHPDGIHGSELFHDSGDSCVLYRVKNATTTSLHLQDVCGLCNFTTVWDIASSHGLLEIRHKWGGISPIKAVWYKNASHSGSAKLNISSCRYHFHRSLRNMLSFVAFVVGERVYCYTRQATSGC